MQKRTGVSEVSGAGGGPMAGEEFRNAVLDKVIKLILIHTALAFVTACHIQKFEPPKWDQIL